MKHENKIKCRQFVCLSKYVIPNFNYIYNYESVGFLPISIKIPPFFSKYNY